MDPSFAEFLNLLQSGGNVALIAAAWMLWRAVHSLARIETFMSTLFEVLLRSDGLKIRDADRERLREMRSAMTGKNRQGGFIMFRSIALIGVALALLSFTSFAFAQTLPTDAARVTWTNATQLTDGAAIPAPPDPLSLKQTTVQRSLDCTASNFGTVAQTINVTPDVLSVLYENLRPAGKHCFRSRHVQTNDGVSAWSAVVSKQITIPAPAKSRPPTITIE